MVERGCPACGSTEIDLATDAAPISQADVDEMRALLAGWRGDIQRLLDAR